MQPVERNPRFSNKLLHSSSPYLRQHAHNPVFWYPWGEEALARARAEDKPILLSIGYSTCYWCHVMEREVFENLSIASMMNRYFINIKVDREEHPQLDDIYMVARQVITREGGWPNNVFLTPDVKPFHAGGTFGPDDWHDRPAFPRLLERLNYAWHNQREDMLKNADTITNIMQGYLVHAPAAPLSSFSLDKEAKELCDLLANYYDGRAGGFFQAPKFPHECYLHYLLGYYYHSGEQRALDMAVLSLRKMAAGGIHDMVGCGFHRYAVDKEWYIPHFEKMLYNQAMLARNYTDAARLTGNVYFADIARSILEFVSAPFTDANGAFYSAIDAETDGVEGAYYAWTLAEIQQALTQAEYNFFITYFSFAEIPSFPGHKHTEGQVIVASKPLDLAAVEHGVPYMRIAAMAGQVFNKLLTVRNGRVPPRLDNKIIVAWNGLMIDAYAEAARVFAEPRYAKLARLAADFILEKAIDNDGNLCRIFADSRPQHAATLEDYAYLIKGLITLWRATPEDVLLESAKSLTSRVEELFKDETAPGYYFTQRDDSLLVRIKNGDDSTLPNANAVMLHNLAELYAITREEQYNSRAQAMVEYFLHAHANIALEASSMMHAALTLHAVQQGKPLPTARFTALDHAANAAAIAALPEVVRVSANIFPPDAGPGDICEVIATLDIQEGWHVNADRVPIPYLIPLRADIKGEGIELVGIVYPEARRKQFAELDPELWILEGLAHITLRIKLPSHLKERPPLTLRLRYQPCNASSCHAAQEMLLDL